MNLLPHRLDLLAICFLCVLVFLFFAHYDLVGICPVAILPRWRYTVARLSRLGNLRITAIVR